MFGLLSWKWLTVSASKKHTAHEYTDMKEELLEDGQHCWELNLFMMSIFNFALKIIIQQTPYNTILTNTPPHLCLLLQTSSCL